MKKSVVSVLVAAVAMIATAIALGYLFSFLFPSMNTEYENSAIYRPWNDPLMYLFILQPFVLTGMLVWGWNKLKDHFTGSAGRKALDISLIMLFLSIIPGMLMSISTFKVSVLAIITWTISAFVQVWVASLIFIKINE